MWLLVAGLVLWSVVHFIPAKALGFRQSLVESLGEKGYMGVFSLVVIASLVMIVFGWRSTVPEYLYMLPSIARPLSFLLMLIALVLFVASNLTTRIKQVLRHPQLTSVILWSVAHLLSNGDSRSLVLFGGMGIWAILQIVAINKRDGEWVKPDVPPISVEIKLALISLIVFVAVGFAHPYLAGMPIF